MMNMIPVLCLWILSFIVHGCSGLTSWVGSGGTTYTRYFYCSGAPGGTTRCWYNSAHPSQGCCHSGAYTSATCCISFRCKFGPELYHYCKDISHERCCPIAPSWSYCCNDAQWTSYLGSSSRSSWSRSVSSFSYSSSLSKMVSERLGYSNSRFWSGIYSASCSLSSIRQSSSYSSWSSVFSSRSSSSSLSYGSSYESSCSNTYSSLSSVCSTKSISQRNSYESICSKSSYYWSSVFSKSCPSIPSSSCPSTSTASCPSTSTASCPSIPPSSSDSIYWSSLSASSRSYWSTVSSSSRSYMAEMSNNPNSMSSYWSKLNSSRSSYESSWQSFKAKQIDQKSGSPCSNTGAIVGGTAAGFLFLVLVIVGSVMGSQLAAARSKPNSSADIPRGARPLHGFERPVSSFDNIAYESNELAVAHHQEMSQGNCDEEPPHIYEQLRVPQT